MSYNQPSFHCAPCLISAGGAVPTDRRAAVSTIFPSWSTIIRATATGPRLTLHSGAFRLCFFKHFPRCYNCTAFAIGVYYNLAILDYFVLFKSAFYLIAVNNLVTYFYF
nr:MAG TPA: hypothetical protein [Bacteriophage sp.]